MKPIPFPVLKGIALFEQARRVRHIRGKYQRFVAYSENELYTMLGRQALHGRYGSFGDDRYPQLHPCGATPGPLVVHMI